MGIKYDLYRNPTTNKEKQEKMHARVVSRRTTDTETIVRQIEYASSLTEGDVIAALSTLTRMMVRELENGNRVHLEGLGYFYLTLTCLLVDSPKEIRAESVKVKTLAFRPEIKLKNYLKGVRVERVKIKNHSKSLSETEIDHLLSSYFKENQYLTRLKFQELCGFTDSTAARYLKILVKNEKLRKSSLSPRLYEPTDIPNP